jgi:hypothetical protein
MSGVRVTVPPLSFSTTYRFSANFPFLVCENTIGSVRLIALCLFHLNGFSDTNEGKPG